MRVFLLFCLLAVLSGCGAPAQRILHIASPQHRHVLRWGIAGESDISTLDPALASDPVSLSVASLVYGGLVCLDGHLRVRPDGARRWTISPDGRTYTFYLRPHLRFADGQVVTASDVRAGLLRALGPDGAAGPASFYLGPIAHPNGQYAIQALGRHVLRITLDHPASSFLAQLAFPVSYVPQPDLFRFQASWTDHAAGFGPYRVQRWDHGRRLVLVRNPYYYAGRPDIRRIVLQFYATGRAAVADYSAGKLDIVSGFAPGQSIGHISGAVQIPALALDYLAFNVDHTPFSRLPVRRALAAALAGMPSQAAFPTQTFVPAGLNIRAPLWRPRHSPHWYMRRARLHTFPSTTLVVPQDPGVVAEANAVAQRWAGLLHITVEVRPLNPSDYNRVLDEHAFDLAIVRWGADFPDPEDFLGTQLGPSADNVTRWTDSAYQRDIGTADRLTPTDPHRLRLLLAAARDAALHVPIVPLDAPPYAALISPHLHGIALTGLGTISANWNRVSLLSS